MCHIQRLPTVAMVLTMPWVNRSHIASSPWPRSQPIMSPNRPLHVYTHEAQSCIARQPWTEQVSRVSGTPSLRTPQCS
jgi:hypothetical protein